MLHFKPSELNANHQYKLLSSTIVPRPIAWISTKSQAGIDNLAPFSFFNVVSVGKPLISVAIFNGGQQKDTAKNLIETKEAVIHLVNSDNLIEMNQTASPIPADISEVDYFKLKTTTSQAVDVLSLSNADVRFEVKLYQHVPISENGVVLTDFFILEIIHFTVNEKLVDLDNFHFDMAKLKPIARLAGNDYGKIGEIFQIERPI